MADKRNRTPFYGAVPTSKMQADHVFMADGSTLQEQADKKFELIEEITLTEDTALIERTTEPNGTPYNFKYLILFIDTPSVSATRNVYFDVNGNTVFRNGLIRTNRTYSKNDITINFGVLNIVSVFGTSGSGAVTYNTYAPTGVFTDYISITKLNIYTSGTDTIPTDSKIKIYGVRI